ncbi:hypothetical protein ABIE28_001736 [Devosia sp. 2618]
MGRATSSSRVATTPMSYLKRRSSARVNKDGSPSSLGTPILYAVTGTSASLTMLGVYGLITSNMDAFIEFSATAAGSLAWLGQGGNVANIFKDSEGVLSEQPPSALSISYFNPGLIRGSGLSLRGNLSTEGNMTVRTGSAFATSARLKVGAVDGTGIGTVGIETAATSNSARDHMVIRNAVFLHCHTLDFGRPRFTGRLGHSAVGCEWNDTTGGVKYMKSNGTGSTGWKLVTQAP